MLIYFVQLSKMHTLGKGFLVGNFVANAAVVREWDTAQNAVGLAAPFTLGIASLTAAGILFSPAPVTIGRGLGIGTALWAGSLSFK